MNRMRKKKKIIIIVSVVIAIALAIFLIARPKNKKYGTDDFTYYVSDNKIVAIVKNASSVYMKYGKYDEISQKDAEQISDTPLYSAFNCLYNGDYTICANMNDGTKEIRHIYIDANTEPIKLKADGSKIDIEVINNFKIDSLSYCYGQRLGDVYASFIPLDKDARDISALGNGWHTFRILATKQLKSEVYYLAVNVTGCAKPQVLLFPEAIGVFSYGFDIKDISYLEGSFNSWSDFASQNGRIHVIPNSTLDVKNFKSSTYTFGYEGPTNYLVTITL